MSTPVQPVLQTASGGNTFNTTTSSHFGQLLEPKLRKLFFETYDELPEQYSQIFHVKSSEKRTETDYGMGAFKPWTARSSNIAEVTYQTLSPGLERTYSHTAFADGFMIAREDADDELYSVIEKFPKALARAGRGKVETDAASVLNNAFSDGLTAASTDVAIYDGLTLCANTHDLLDSASNGDNLTTGALSDTTLRTALQLGREQLDEAGQLCQMKFDTLIVPPELQFTAEVLMNSDGLAGSPNNDINVMKGRLKVIVNDYLTSATAWFLQDSSRHELNFFWRQRPEFKRDEDFDTFVAKYRGYMRYSYGVSDWRGLIGSAGQ